MKDKSPAERLDSARYLFLRELHEPTKGALRLVVQEAVSGPPVGGKALRVLPKNLRKLFGARHLTRPIVSDDSCFSYEIVWPSYISYSVRDEDFATVDKAEKYKGRFLRRYSRSNYLDYLSNATYAEFFSKGQFSHWGVVTLTRIVDVASVEAPAVRRFKSYD